MLAASTSATNITIPSSMFLAARSARPAIPIGGATPSRLPNGTITPPGSHTFAQNALATSTINKVRIPDQTRACTVVIISASPQPRERYGGRLAGFRMRRNAVASASGKVPYQRQSREQAANRQRNRRTNVERHKGKLATLVQQRGVERECRKRRVAAENAGSEQEAPMLRTVALEGEIGREQSHDQGPGDVLEQ